MDKPRVKLNNWKLVSIGGAFTLIGECEGHPRLGNESIRTSRVIKTDFEKMEAETLNTIYELGDECN